MDANNSTDTLAMVAANVPEPFWKCSYEGSFYISENLGDIVDEVKELEVGQKYTIERVSMTRAEFEGLPEFSGF